MTTLHQTRSVTAKRAVRRLRSILPGVPLRSSRVIVWGFGINRSRLRPPHRSTGRNSGGGGREGGGLSERFYGGRFPVSISRRKRYERYFINWHTETSVLVSREQTIAYRRKPLSDWESACHRVKKLSLGFCGIYRTS